jgi:peptide/nickel transport system permease protein
MTSSTRGLAGLAARIVSVLFVLFGIAVISFLLMRLVPGDAVDALLGQGQRDKQTAETLRRVLGLDRSLPQQFVDWSTALLHGDLGVSFRSHQPVATEILQRLPATLELAAAGLIVSLVAGLSLGVLSAIRRNSWLDLSSRLISLIGVSLPNFWLGIFLILIFGVYLHLLPSGGYVPLTQSVPDNLKFLIMPAVALGVANAAVIMRLTRSTLLEVLHTDYVRTAFAKGLREQKVVTRHALRNALIPIITVIGIQVGSILGGTVIIEQVFSWPGLGSLVVTAVLNRDYPVVQGVTMLLAAFFVLASLVVDVTYMYVDPRLRRG